MIEKIIERSAKNGFMVGGMVTSTVLTLIIIPVIYDMWRGWGLKRKGLKNT